MKKLTILLGLTSALFVNATLADNLSATTPAAEEEKTFFSSTVDLLLPDKMRLNFQYQHLEGNIIDTFRDHGGQKVVTSYTPSLVWDLYDTGNLDFDLNVGYAIYGISSSYKGTGYGVEQEYRNLYGDFLMAYTRMEYFHPYAVLGVGNMSLKGKLYSYDGEGGVNVERIKSKETSVRFGFGFRTNYNKHWSTGTQITIQAGSEVESFTSSAYIRYDF